MDSMRFDSPLCLAANLEDLPTVRSFVRARAVALGAPPELIYDLLLVTEEAVTNVLIHGYQRQPGTVEVYVTREGEEIVIRVSDQAPLFDPTCVPPPDLTVPLGDRPLGHLGIHLMRQHTDVMIHRVPPHGGNELILKKRITQERNRA